MNTLTKQPVTQRMVDEQYAHAAKRDAEASRMFKAWSNLSDAQSPRDGKEDTEEVQAAWKAYTAASEASRNAYHNAGEIEKAWREQAAAPKPITFWELMSALKRGLPVEIGGESFACLDSVEREDGSGHCWNVTGYLFDAKKHTVFVRTTD